MASPQYAVQVLTAYHQILNSITSHRDLKEILIGVCNAVDAIFEDSHAKCSIQLLVDNKLKAVAGPRLPSDYLDAIDNLDIGPTVGSCGTAMYHNQQVIVSDISKDPLWDNYRDIAHNFSLAACWSTPVTDSDGKVIASFAIYYDVPKVPTDDELDIIKQVTHLVALAISQTKEMKKNKALFTRLQRANNQLAAIGKVLPDHAFVTDEDGYYLDHFGGEEDLLVIPDRSFIGKKVSDTLPDSVSRKIYEAFNRLFATGETQVVEYALQVARGECFFEARITELKDYDHRKGRYTLTLVREITERKKNELRVEQLAFYDPLTGLPNRRLLLERLKMAKEDLIRNKTFTSLLFLDLDKFKSINDGEGHNEGDVILKDISDKLHRSLRSNDTLARHGGDEFVVLIGAHQNKKEDAQNDAKIVAEKLRFAVRDPYEINGHTYQLGASIGIVVLNGEMSDVEGLIKRADKAMYQAKSKGGNTFHLA